MDLIKKAHNSVKEKVGDGLDALNDTVDKVKSVTDPWRVAADALSKMADQYVAGEKKEFEKKSVELAEKMLKIPGPKTADFVEDMGNLFQKEAFEHLDHSLAKQFGAYFKTETRAIKNLALHITHPDKNVGDVVPDQGDLYLKMMEIALEKFTDMPKEAVQDKMREIAESVIVREDEEEEGEGNKENEKKRAEAVQKMGEAFCKAAEKKQKPRFLPKLPPKPKLPF